MVLYLIACDDNALSWMYNSGLVLCVAILWGFHWVTTSKKKYVAIIYGLSGLILLVIVKMLCSVCSYCSYLSVD